MIVYRQQEQPADPRTLLRELCHGIDRTQRVVKPAVDSLIHLLIDAGELATGVADADGTQEAGAAGALHQVTEHLASATCAGWRGDAAAIARELAGARRAADQCHPDLLPASIGLRVSEGFAYYALGPELYHDAARRWHAHGARRDVWCVGVRTIGLTLAAIVAATLRELGADTRLRSVRPIGHPFSRRVRFDDRSQEEFRASPQASFVVVDEGPGISGSSMAAVADALCGLDIAEARVILMPGHAPAIERFADAGVRHRWTRHAIYAADHDAAWIDSGRLAREWSADELVDLSAGKWRTHKGGAVHVAVHPHHERRKYLLRRGVERSLLKFTGYGRYGDSTARRTAEAAAAGWAPEPHASRGGWTEWPWLEHPVASARPAVVDAEQLAEYLAFTRRTWATGCAAKPDALREMAAHNIGELCAAAESAAFDRLAVDATAAEVRLDARVRPHEWLCEDGRYLKTDGAEHHDDHFFPGPTDIAWDVAGVIEEWRMGAAEAAALVAAFGRASGDARVGERLPFYRAAFLAFRAAYCAFGADQLTGTPDEPPMRAAADGYLHQLRSLLGTGTPLPAARTADAREGAAT